MSVLSTMTVRSPIGALRIVASLVGLRAVLWPHDNPERVRLADAHGRVDDPILLQTAQQLAEYFAGERTAFTVPLDPAGTPFQLRVWAALGLIPFGATSTYGQIAEEIGKPGAARAVGAANGRNPLSIVVPCHRVVGADGSLTGFAGGVDVKRWLLQHEGVLSFRAPQTALF